MAIAGKASEVFLLLELLAKYFGDVTIGELLTTDNYGIKHQGE